MELGFEPSRSTFLLIDDSIFDNLLYRVANAADQGAMEFSYGGEQRAREQLGPHEGQSSKADFAIRASPFLFGFSGFGLLAAFSPGRAPHDRWLPRTTLR